MLPGCPEMNTGGALLIIEDDADVQRAARIALSAKFERIDTLSVPEDGLEARLTAADYDVVLLDMNFVAGERSGAAGLDALTRIRTCDSTLAVVLLSPLRGGRSEARNVMRAMRDAWGMRAVPGVSAARHTARSGLPLRKALPGADSLARHSG